MLIFLCQLFKYCFLSRSRTGSLQKYADPVVGKQIVSRVQVSGLLITIAVFNRFPVPAARWSGAAEFWTFETAVFENYRASITVSSVSNAAEALHVTFELEEKLKGRERKSKVRLCPFCIHE